MQNGKLGNVLMISIAAVVILAADAAVWMGVRNGMVAAESNLLLWTCFMALNAVSIVWAIAMLGVQPLVVALTYIAGGFLVYKSAGEGSVGTNLAELTVAGATYAAFGALAASNLSAKVRFAFYSRVQVPFVFIIIALLALDAGLNATVSKPSINEMVKAMVVPFAAVGCVAGFGWSLLMRFALGGRKKIHHGVEAEAETAHVSEKQAATHEKADVAHAVARNEPPATERKETPFEEVPKIQPVTHQPRVAVPVIEEIVPVEATLRDEPKAEEDDFVPLEIDRDESFSDFEYDVEPEAAKLKDDISGGFDSGHYGSARGERSDYGAVMVEEEPITSVDLAVDEEVVPNVKNQEAKEKAPPADNKKSDWLSGHLDLLSKLK